MSQIIRLVLYIIAIIIVAPLLGGLPFFQTYFLKLLQCIKSPQVVVAGDEYKSIHSFFQRIGDYFTLSVHRTAFYELLSEL